MVRCPLTANFIHAVWSGGSNLGQQASPFGSPSRYYQSRTSVRHRRTPEEHTVRRKFGVTLNHFSITLPSVSYYCQVTLHKTKQNKTKNIRSHRYPQNLSSIIK
jgi:hypothetical protein